jgi:hypothetical protein
MSERLVSLSSGLTFSFFTNASAFSFIALWSRTMSLAQARTWRQRKICARLSAGIINHV